PLASASTSPAPPALSPPSLHDALPISAHPPARDLQRQGPALRAERGQHPLDPGGEAAALHPAHRDLDPAAAHPGRRGGRDRVLRSEEHTSELQSRFDLVCRLLLEKKDG